METSLQNLSALSCVVKANFPHSKSECSSCGTIIDPQNGIVLSHGAILTEHVTANKALLSKIREGALITSNDLSVSGFTLLLSNHYVSSNLSEKVGKNYNKNSLVVSGASSLSSRIVLNEGSLSDFAQVSCHFIGAFRNGDFHNTLIDLMPSNSWTFNDAISDSDNNDSDSNLANSDNNNTNRQIQKQEIGTDSSQLSEITNYLLSYFLLFKFNYSDVQLEIPNDALGLSSDYKSSSLLSIMTRDRCVIGDTAEIIATPFGALCPAVFFNTYSRGVISNVGGVNNCWIVTDTRCIPGCEGGPLYTKIKPSDTESFLTGIIASSLCWKNNEWVGFSVACSLDSIIKSILQHEKSLQRENSVYCLPTSIHKEKISIWEGQHSKAQAVTVLIQCGNTWGSGVVVDRDQGVILTCSHVVKDAGSHPVTVTTYKSTSKYSGDVVFRQVPVKSAYDLAVIKCPQATQHNLHKDGTVSVTAACVGQDVVACGHAVFGAEHRLEPSICRGVVSKVIRTGSKAVMVQTTCAIHAGVSGGPVFSLDGDLVAVIVCNTRDTASNTSFPHVNLCIPVSTVWPAITRYVSTGDKECLSQLVVRDVALNELWALGVQTSCHGVGDTMCVPTSKL